MVILAKGTYNFIVSFPLCLLIFPQGGLLLCVSVLNWKDELYSLMVFAQFERLTLSLFRL